jgi:hypothetical protein
MVGLCTRRGFGVPQRWWQPSERLLATIGAVIEGRRPGCALLHVATT